MGLNPALTKTHLLYVLSNHTPRSYVRLRFVETDSKENVKGNE